MNAEKWRPVPGLGGQYEVSSLGRVRSVERVTVDSRGRSRRFPSKLLKPRVHKVTGYVHVNLWVSGQGRTSLLHQLVAETFIGPRPPGMQIAHRDGFKTNNAISNLRYATLVENAADQVLHRTRPLGQNRAFAVLADESVRAIDEALRAGRTQASLARRFGVCEATISQIARGHTWRHITGRPRLEVRPNARRAVA